MLPLPGLDLAAIIVIQLSMVKKMSLIYGAQFSHDLAKPLLTTLISGSGTGLVSSICVSMAKGVPVIGTLTGMFAMPALSAASTWATGKVFIRHFESGGTFLDFDPEKARIHYIHELAAARTTVG